MSMQVGPERTAHLVDEGLVKLLVGVVDAELLQTIELHAFEPEDVQHTNPSKLSVRLAVDARVTPLHDISEDHLSTSVPRL